MRLNKVYYTIKHYYPLRMLLSLLLFICFVTPTFAQTHDIIIVETIDVPVVTEFTQAFLSGMDTHGYRTETFQRYNAQGNKSRAATIASQISEQKSPALVVTVATLASTAVWNVLQDTNIPMMFAVVSDPVGAELVQAIDTVSGDNITGLTANLDKDTQMRFAYMLASQMIQGRSKPIRLGIVTSDYPSSVSDIQMLKQAALEYDNLEIKDYIIDYDGSATGIPAMLEEVRLGIRDLDDKIDFWWEVSGPLGEIPEYIEMLIYDSSKPILFGNTLHSVMHGAIFTMIPDTQKTGFEAAGIAHSIMQGIDPGTIPIKPPSNFILGLNMRSALDRDIVVPAQMLELAGNHIYW